MHLSLVRSGERHRLIQTFMLRVNALAVTCVGRSVGHVVLYQL